MIDLIFAAGGLVAAVLGTWKMLGLVGLKKNGKLVLAEVVAVREKKKGAFVHTLRYETDGGITENDDRSCFNIPFSEGEKQLIYVDKNDETRFEYEKEVNKNIIIYCIMIGAALLFAVRFFIDAFF